jgi:hypothetical protein
MATHRVFLRTITRKAERPLYGLWRSSKLQVNFGAARSAAIQRAPFFAAIEARIMMAVNAEPPATS